MDARIEATRQRLREAIFELAAEKDVSAISVAELSRAAGIDRSTFYGHADSPAGLLAVLLAEDLEPLRVAVEETLESAPGTLAAVGEQLNARLVDHVERHAAIYADRGDGGRINFALYSVLSGYTRTALESVFGHLAEAGAPVPPSADDRRYLAAFVAHGIVGAITTWLAEPEPRDRTRLERVLGLVYTNWLVPAASAIEGETP
ncbi:TetR/AcrR family transcriptional regulator [Actinacidiphila acididurans]|uniref:TetR/AcrR family transcriptional regulator n=1 Tax=Actinacidiphila acididurans TaxID=2784346 RepID=A0ABS2U4Y5_9ACTN|nr:TetR/AcrR family transcriptional regulator [Actinacidiphila acididurans]MBM9510654.1 TetR/AcrR family transcriptional regulator [Actinacidiphila acididurans]